MQQLKETSLFFRWMHEENIDINDFVQQPPKSPDPPFCETSSTVSEIQRLPPDKADQTSLHPFLNASSTKETRSMKRTEVMDCQDRHHITKKDPDFFMKNQKKNRNVLSNLVHHFLKFLSSNSKISALVEKIISQHRLLTSLSEFNSALNSRLKSLKSYITEKHLRSLLFGNLQLISGEQREFERALLQFHFVVRILAKWFYNYEAYNSIILSNKLSMDSKKLHYEGIKDIISILNDHTKAAVKREKPTSKKNRLKT